MKRRTAVLALIGVSLLTACSDNTRIIDPLRSTGGASFAKDGNSDAAQACQQGGWQHLQGSDGTLFHNTGDCVSYAAHGGTLVPIPVAPPVIASFTFDGVQSSCLPDGGGSVQALLTATFSNGVGTIDAGGTITPVISGVQVALSASGTYTLTVANSAGSVSQTLQPFGGSAVGCGSNNRRPPTPGRFSSTSVAARNP